MLNRQMLRSPPVRGGDLADSRLEGKSFLSGVPAGKGGGCR